MVEEEGDRGNPERQLNPVMHDWVLRLPWKMQTVLMAAIRGPDASRDSNIKLVNRWIRTICMRDADPTNTTFHHQDGFPPIITYELEHELEYQPVHYFGHFIHALEIIGYNHPDPDLAAFAMNLYWFCVQDILHLTPETAETLRIRLADKVAP